MATPGRGHGAPRALPAPERSPGGDLILGDDKAIEFSLSRPAAARLAQLPGVAASGRARRIRVTWHDRADGSLLAAKCALSEQDGLWRLERLAPGPDGAWPPGTPFSVPAEARTAVVSSVGEGETVEVARFTGRERTYALDGLDGVRIALLRGTAEAANIRQAACRLRLTGPKGIVEAACSGLGATLKLSIPRSSVAAEVLGVAPALPGAEPAAAGSTLGDYIVAALPPLVWPVMLRIDAVAASPSVEGIHEARVAVRRLRSVLGVLRRPTASDAAASMRPMLHDLAGCLGEARDWDVFLGGIGTRLEARLGGDRDAVRLLTAARRQRAGAYATLAAILAGPMRQALERHLACFAVLRPWEAAGPNAALLAEEAARFAAVTLDRRLHRVRRAGRGFKHLPLHALHTLRKDSKRLRYAAEAFAPLFPGARSRRFLKRLRAVQGTLGEMQDDEVARALLDQLGAAGHGYAGGLALGLMEGRGEALRTEARAAWQLFGKAEAFWT